jgi:hypothetical protein
MMDNFLLEARPWGALLMTNASHIVQELLPVRGGGGWGATFMISSLNLSWHHGKTAIDKNEAQ